MDSQQFDELTRRLAQGASRRRVLKGLVAGLAGGGALAVANRETLAQCLEDGEECSSPTQCCGGACIEGLCSGCETHDDCPDDLLCCGPGDPLGVCRDVECCIDNPDPNETCPEGTSCFEGQCDPLCVEEECDEGTCCCNDQTCSADCCEVTNLPDTGVGDREKNVAWIGAAAIGGAAAYLAGRRLREREATVENE
jgi:LPXTG-motif cell wall-anchored protein